MMQADLMEIFNDEPSMPEAGIDDITRLFGEQDTEAIPSERLFSVSDEDRSQGLYDLHGVSDAIEETPEFVAKKLEEIDLELILVHGKDSYEEAARQSPSYVQSLRLRFLRAERFEASRAASRMARHFEQKEEFFGREKLGRDLTLEDLTPDERKTLDSGFVQVLPQRDRGGRAIIVLFGRMHIELELTTSLKLTFLLHCFVSTDEEVQKKGSILVYYALGQTTRKNYDRSVPIVNCMMAFPVHLVGIHSCYDHPVGQFVMNLFAYALNTMYLCRLRCHSGTHIEAQYSLMTFGIPIDTIPFKTDGTVETTDHVKWLQSMEKITKPEDAPKGTNPGLVLVPGPLDILMGRGQRKASGNRRFRKLLEEHRGKYDTACKFEKNVVAQMLFKLLTDQGARFLKQTDAGWIQIEDDTAIDKISHGFRNLRISTR